MPSSAHCHETRIIAAGSESDSSPPEVEKCDAWIPWRAIQRSAVLFIFGSISITVSLLMFTGYIHAQYSDGAWPLLIIGIITFLPGFYYIRIAYYAWKGYSGFSFKDIPYYDD